jgi:D-glycero-D-manno-heptose 1,7-bisphosphate phosphatase
MSQLEFNLKPKLIILDRDGVINYDSVNYIRSPDDWHPIPGSLEAIARLKKAGFKIAVATNQSGISRGYYTEETLTAIHQKMQDALALLDTQIDVRIDAIFYCPHLPTENCDCRKPKPGLLQKIAQHFQCDITNVPFIGDNLSDIQAAIAASASPILIADTPFLGYDCPHFPNLSAVADAILTIRMVPLSPERKSNRMVPLPPGEDAR